MKTSAAVFVTLAMTGGTPIASKAGYETSEAKPAKVDVNPAPIPAISRKAKIEKFILLLQEFEWTSSSASRNAMCQVVL